LLRVVLALPYASRTGLACTIWSSSEPCYIFKKENNVNTHNESELKKYRALQYRDTTVNGSKVHKDVNDKTQDIVISYDINIKNIYVYKSTYRIRKL